MDTYLWHYKLDFINNNRINRLTNEKIFDINECESLPTCESCLLKKMTKSYFTKNYE